MILQMEGSKRAIGLFTIIICTSLIALAACSLPGSEGDPGSGSKRLIEVDPEHQVCEDDLDCALVYIDCSDCGCGLAVNEIFKQLYESKYSDQCAAYQGPVCEIECPPIELRCEASRCIAEPME